MRTLRLTLAYDGTDFLGWQVQSVGRTVQGELEAAVEKITGERVRLAGAGRTDSGVHALGQVASFRTTTTIPSDKLRLGLESALTAGDLAVLDVADVPEDFHARHSARGKLYRYQVLNSRLRAPLLRRFTWQVRAPLDRAAMREAAAVLVGTHDFSSFRLAGCDARTPVREMRRLELIEREDGVLWIELEASAFLRGMVRAIVGTLVEVGRGRRPASDMPAILASCDRGAAGRSAPACGLTLVRVAYE
ncbi:MAG: tRNA pseudouridine(38-40) synthase TruA [Deltaproteobacteria bacterium]|nr:tRNA pseudouridine(38-40) synthase TruA [Deltaproteobacteria bacterium]